MPRSRDPREGIPGRGEGGRRLTVLCVVRHLLGGIRTYLKYTYGNLDPSAYRFIVLAVDSPEAHLITSDLAHHDVRLVTVRAPHARLALLTRLVSLLREEEVDVIHSNGITSGLLSALGNLYAGVPHIVTFHDVFRADQFRGIRGRAARWLIGSLLRRADTLQHVSEDGMDNLRSFLSMRGTAARKLVVIRNGIAFDAFPEEMPPNEYRLELHRRLAINDDVVCLGFLGRFMPQKGFVDLVRAVEMMEAGPASDRAFVVVSVNHDDFIREYRGLIGRRGLERHFLFPGFFDSVNSLLRGLDAVVMPSLWEACPLLAMEAFVAGCPLIASDCLGLREVIRESPALEAEHGNASSLCAALRRFLTAPETYKVEALLFVPAAKERFNARDTAARLDARLQSLASLGPRRWGRSPGRRLERPASVP